MTNLFRVDSVEALEGRVAVCSASLLECFVPSFCRKLRKRTFSRFKSAGLTVSTSVGLDDPRNCRLNPDEAVAVLDSCWRLAWSCWSFSK